MIVECKASERLPATAKTQLIGDLRATIFEVGVLLHFGEHPKFYRFVDTIKKRPRDDGALQQNDAPRDSE